MYVYKQNKINLEQMFIPLQVNIQLRFKPVPVLSAVAAELPHHIRRSNKDPPYNVNRIAFKF